MPKIRTIEIIPLEYVIPKERLYGISRGPNLKRTSTLVAVTTESGVTGYGETISPAAPVKAGLPALLPLYLGRSVHEAGLLHARAASLAQDVGAAGFAGCLSALDMALHDAAGKVLNRPVCDLIGGRGRERVPCYATTGYITSGGLSGLEAQLAAVDRTAFTGVKIKIGLGPPSDLARVRLAREILGDAMLLMVDVNANYDVATALQSARLIAPYDIHWYEEPLPAHDISGHASLRARSPIPIATGEGITRLADFKALLDARGADIIQPALARCGGVSGAHAVAALCEAAGSRVTLGVWGGACLLAASAHVMASRAMTGHAASRPFPHMLEFDLGQNPLREAIARRPLRPEGGSVRVPEGPGFGVVLDPAAMDAYRAA